MFRLTRYFKEKQIHEVFEISVVLKGIHAVAETVGGFLLLFVSKDFIIATILFLTHEELGEDPKDFIARSLVTAAHSLSFATTYFAALYLLSHGVIKLFLVVGLLRKKLWAYPGSMAVFALFILYQLYRYSHTHSAGLLWLTGLDGMIIFLTFHEYRYMKARGLFKA